MLVRKVKCKHEETKLLELPLQTIPQKKKRRIGHQSLYKPWKLFIVFACNPSGRSTTISGGGTKRGQLQAPLGFPKQPLLQRHSPQCRPVPTMTSRESQSKPGTKMVHPEPCKEIRRRISAAIYGWDWPLLIFIYPGFGGSRLRPPNRSPSPGPSPTSGA